MTPSPVIWQGQMPSDTRPDKVYNITVYKNGDTVCSCPDFILRGANTPLGMRYRCKHIRRVIDQSGIAFSGDIAIVTAPSQSAQAPNSFALGADELTRVARRGRPNLDL